MQILDSIENVTNETIAETEKYITELKLKEKRKKCDGQEA